jgi:hypothetical protein
MATCSSALPPLVTVRLTVTLEPASALPCAASKESVRARSTPAAARSARLRNRLGSAAAVALRKVVADDRLSVVFGNCFL